MPEQTIECPKCGSTETSTEWVENTIGEYQHAECYDCDLEWNECARETWEVWYKKEING